MPFEDTRIAIEQAFITGWVAGAYSTVQVFYENHKVQNAGQTYLKHCIVDTYASQAEINGGVTTYNRYSGYVQIEVIVPEDDGTSNARKMADVAAAIYRKTQTSYGTSGTITFRVPQIRSIGVISGAYMFVVTAPFSRDAFE